MPKVDFKDQFRVAFKNGGWMVVDSAGVPCGPMRDFYSQETTLSVQVSRNPYPKEFREDRQSPMAKPEADDALKRLKLHVQAVIDHIKKPQRVGSSAHWDRPIFVD